MKINNTKTYEIQESIIASGYAMNIDLPKDFDEAYLKSLVDDNRHVSRAKTLGNAINGSGHDNFLSGILVSFDLTAPLYFWKQFQRYHFAQIVSSQSTMHMILEMNLYKQCNENVFPETIQALQSLINSYKKYKEMYPDDKETLKKPYQQIISNIPSGLELTARISTNYLQLKNMIKQRKNHKLEEWQYFCAWAESLPHFYELCLHKKSQ